MTDNNPIVSFFDGLLDHIPVPSLNGQDNNLSKQFLQEVERYELEAQRFQAIKQHLNEIPDKHMVDDNF
ncbi:hypothetical protein [Anaerovibrio lipolyticus]|uniref:hypothetical protein n=1 Tax=Anaerovibrio lipolyticus TaxID=82374 RepID=UPI00048875D2|nr:hypothetical protein [Anaerovibrio lipolyticus]